MGSNSVTLIITAAIDITNYLPFRTSVVDKSIRLKQYLDSLRYAIINYHSITNIVFADNTNFQYDYSEIFLLARKFEKELEIITFKGDMERTKKQGKGFGEGEILHYVVINSKLLQRSKAFVKLTGRLTVKNFDSIIKNTTENQNYFFLPSFIWYHRVSSMSTVLYKVNKDFFVNHLLKAYEKVNDKENLELENLYFAIVKPFSPTYFKYYPLICGQSGSNGTYHNNVSAVELWKRKLIFRLSSVFQKLIIR